MIADRYPTPFTDDAFGRQQQIDNWMFISKQYAIKAAEEAGDSAAAARIRKWTPTSPQSVAEYEKHTGHEVVAFLQIMEERNPEEARYLHVGLTSSDLVEYALCAGMEQHSRDINATILVLQTALRELPDVRRLSRTHGQVGYVTTTGAEFSVVDETLQGLRTQIRLFPRVLKIPGPSGAMSPIEFRGFSVASDLDRRAVRGTQILHRDHVLAWASIYLRLACVLENLALQIRLGARTDVGEFREGAADSRSGSSAMPHKKNPIDSEKVCGLARVARGYFGALAEGVALWESRDLSNSSAERVAVYGLAGVVEHMLATTLKVTQNLVINENRMSDNVERHMEWRTHLAQYALQVGAGFGPVEASQFVRDHVAITPNGRMDIEGSAFELWRHDRETLVNVLNIYGKAVLNANPLNM